MRPTNDPKTEVIKIRVNEETAKELRSRGNVSAVVRELVTEGLKNPKSDSFVPHENHGDISTDNELSKYGITTDIIAELAQIVKLCGGDLKDVLNDMGERLNSAELTITDGRLDIYTDIDLTRLERAAERCNKTSSEMLDWLLDKWEG